MTERLEVRLGWNYEVGGGPSLGELRLPEGERLVREYTLLYGVKVRATDQSGWIPRSAVIVQGFTPTDGSAEASTTTELLAAYVVGWEFRNRWKFDTALRYVTATEVSDRFNQWAPSAVVRVPLGERWAVHGEYFGIVTTEKARNSSRHYFSPGIHYLVNPDLEVGIRLGWGLNDQSARFFTNAGFGWRF